MISGFFGGLSQLPEIQKLYPANFPQTSEEFVNKALSQDIRGDWGGKIRSFLGPQVSPADAKNFLTQWANLAWNSLDKSKTTLRKTKYQALVIALPRTFFPAWDDNVNEIEKRWNNRRPAYKALLNHLNATGSPIDRPTQVEIARQAIGFGRLAQDVLGFLDQQYKVMWNIVYQTKNIDFDVGVDLIGDAAKYVVAEATKIAVKVVEGVVAPVVKGFLGNLPWWAWVVGVGVVGIYAMPLIAAVRRR